MRFRLTALALLLAAGCNFTQSNPDTVPPIQSTVPADHASGVSPDTTITVTMAHELDQHTVTPANIHVTQNGNAVSGSVETDGTTITYTPNNELTAFAQIVVTLTTGIHYATGDALPREQSFTFTTGAALDHTPPTVSATTPDKDAVDVAPSAAVTATFSETMSTATITLTVHGGAAIGGKTTVADRVATFAPTTALPQGVLIDAAVTTDSEDAAGNPLQAEYDWSFTTAIVPFSVTGAQATSSTKVAVTFSAAPKTAEATVAGNYCIGAGTDASCSNVLGVTAAALSGSTVTLTTAVQAPQTAYKVFVGNVTRDPDGVFLAAATAAFNGFNLIANGSFDADTSAPPAGWTETGATGTLTAIAGGSPAAFDGANIAKFSTLSTTTGNNEAASSCFPIDHTKTVTVAANIYTPEAVANTGYAFKIFTYSDTACATTVSGPSASSTATLSAQNTWEQHSATFTPPATAQSAKAGIRAKFQGGGSASSLIYFDNVVVTQP